MPYGELLLVEQMFILRPMRCRKWAVCGAVA